MLQRDLDRRLASFLAGLALAAGLAVPAVADDINRVVLRVNDEILLLHDYEQQKARRLPLVLNDPSLSPAKRQERVANIGKEVLQEALREMLMQSQARRLAITVTDRDVEETIAGIRQEQNIQNDQQFSEALASAGLTVEQLQKNMRRELMMSRLVQKDITSKIEVSDDDLRAYYRNHAEEFRIPEERKLREVIVLEASGLPAAELESTAKSLHEELQKSKDPKETVAHYQDQGISTGFIDLGWLKRNEVERNLADAVWTLEPGRYSPPVKGRGGYHIAVVEEKRGGELRPFNEVEKEITARERQARFGKEFRSYLTRLEQSSYIQENLPDDGVGYRSLATDTEEEDELKGFRAPLPVEEPPAPEVPKVEGAGG
jgi:peptidyl-prolyl cis-trans isomerase SurA